MATGAREQLMNVARVAAPAWAGEATVVRRYFTERRSLEGDVRWIGYQLFKEWSGSGVYGDTETNVGRLLSAAARRVEAIDLSTDAEALAKLEIDIGFASDEFRHTSQLFVLHRHLAPEATGPIESLGALSEGRALTQMRHELRATEKGRVIVDLSEGGGLGMYFGIREHFKAHPPSDEVERQIQEVANRTLRDEVDHLERRFDEACVLGDDEGVWRDVAEGLHRVCVQKLRERNQQFSSPLTEHEMLDALSDERAGAEYLRHHLSRLVRRLESAAPR